MTKTNMLNSEELELLAAGYVLDDLDEAETAQVEQLIQSSPAMREQIRQSLAVMGMVAGDVSPVVPSAGLKNKVRQAFTEESATKTIDLPQKKVINLENWFQEVFEAGWQMAAELMATPTATPAFRTSGIAGGKEILIGSNSTPIILIVTVVESSPFNRDVVVEIQPKSEREYLPSGLQLLLLDTEEEPIMKATTRQDNKNLKFEFSGTSQEAFSIKLVLLDSSFQEDFIL